MAIISTGSFEPLPNSFLTSTYPFLIPVKYPHTNRLRNSIQSLLGENKVITALKRTSLSHSHLTLLQSQTYQVTWRPTGDITHCLLFISKEGSFLFHLSVPTSSYLNDFSFYFIPHLTFPIKTSSSTFHDRTVLSGEIVQDVIQGKAIPRFLVSDILVIDGQFDTKQPHSQRLQTVESEFVAPRSKLSEKEKEKTKLHFRTKSMYPLSKASKILSMKLPHSAAGLVFMPSLSHQDGVLTPVLEWLSSSAVSQDDMLGVLPT